MTDEDKPQAIQELETLDAALGDLDENGADAESDELADTIDVFDKLIEEAEKQGEMDSEAGDFLQDGRAAVQTVLDGEADDETVQEAGEALAVLGKQLQEAMLEAMLGA